MHDYDPRQQNGIIFSRYCLNTLNMPNSQNRSKNNSNSGKGHAKDITSKASASKSNPERSDKKHGREENDGNTNRTSNQGRKSASGGSPE
jgi:hypothetical protein